jgi:hypothetical protein
VIPLSKQETEYPEIGKIRPIAISPAITKLYETILLRRLQTNISQLKPGIHAGQRGFTKGRSMYDNLMDVGHFLLQGKKRDADARIRKVKPQFRSPYYVVFLDISKAFDQVDRPLLIKKLYDFGIAHDLIAAIQNLLENTSHFFSSQGVGYRTSIGVP